MSGLLVGLDYTAVSERLDAAGMKGEERARCVELLIGIEQGAVKAIAEATATEGE